MATLTKVSVNGQVYDLGGSSIGSSMIEITYSELKSFADSASLVPGTKYRITDFVTDYNSDETDRKSAMHQFDIIVTASSNNSLYEDAAVELHKDDVYFDEKQVKKWKIKYSLTSSKFKKGEIIYMIDDKGNEAYFDFKNIMFKASSNEFTHLDSDTFFYLFSSVDSYTGEKNVKDHSLTDYVNKNICKNSSIYKCFFCIKKSSIDYYGKIEGNIIEAGCQAILFENNTVIPNNIKNNKFCNIFYMINPAFGVENNEIKNTIIICPNGNINIKNNIFMSRLGRDNSNPVSISKDIDSCLIIGDFKNVSDITNTEAISNKILTAKSGTVKIVDPFEII